MSETIARTRDDWVRTVLGVDIGAPGGGAAPGAPEGGAAPGAPGDPPSLLRRQPEASSAGAGWVKGKVEAVGDEAGYQVAVAAKNWAAVAEMLEKVKAPELKARMTKFSAEDMDGLYTAACADPKVGKTSAVAMFVQTLQHPVLGSTQTKQADALQAKLSKKDQEKYKALLDGTGAAVEKDYLTKGLASGHSVAALAKFAAKIKGKDAAWLRDNLSLTGASDGSGVKQQWHDSCGPTTFQALKGELDPLYALEMHEKNTDVSKADDSDALGENKALAKEQKTVLVAGGGRAVNRDETGGSGMWIAGRLNKIKASTGLTYDLKKIPDSGTVEGGITVLNDATAKGEPVPISIGNYEGNYQHYVLVTASDPGPPRYYTIHDPWDGKTVIRSEEQMRNGALNIAGCKGLQSYDKPTPVEVK